MISTIHKDFFEKPTAMLLSKDSTMPIAKPTTKLAAKIMKAYIKKKRGKTSRPFSK